MIYLNNESSSDAIIVAVWKIFETKSFILGLSELAPLSELTPVYETSLLFFTLMVTPRTTIIVDHSIKVILTFNVISNRFFKETPTVFNVS